MIHTRNCFRGHLLPPQAEGHGTATAIEPKSKPKAIETIIGATPICCKGMAPAKGDDRQPGDGGEHGGQRPERSDDHLQLARFWPG